jgi:hypothetical protein
MEYLSYLNYLEMKNIYIKKNYLERSLYVKEIINICKKFELSNDTIYLSIELFDKYVSLNDKCNFDILYLTCILLSSKYHDVNYITIDDLLSINTNLSRDNIIKFEISLLKFVNYNITMPTIYTFTEYYIDLFKIDISKSIYDVLYNFIILNIPSDLYSQLSLCIIYYTLNKNVNFYKMLIDCGIHVQINILDKYNI